MDVLFIYLSFGHRVSWGAVDGKKIHLGTTLEGPKGTMKGT